MDRGESHTSHRADAAPTRLALSVAGVTIDVPGDLVAVIVAAEPDVGRELLRWRRMHGPGGRVIIIDPQLVARILTQWPAPS
jgi:hypothetical protein